MFARWYFKIAGAEPGLGSELAPVTTDELRSLVVSGELSDADLVRSENGSTWQRIDSIDELTGTLDALPPSGNSDLPCDRATSDMPSVAESWCSLELNSSDTKASINWTVSSGPTVVDQAETARRASIVRVPRRSLKVAHGATKAGIAEKMARQSTVAAGFDAEADTVVSPEVAPVVDTEDEKSPEHRL